LIVPSVPEPLRDLAAQLDVMLAGTTARDAVYIESGTKGADGLLAACDAPGVFIVRRHEGMLVTTNGEKAQAFSALVADVELGDLLGFPLPKEAATASGCPLVVVGRRKDAAVLVSIATSPAFLAATHTAARALCPAGTTFTVERPLDVLRERIACSTS